MKRFEKIISEYFKNILEQDVPQQDAAMPDPNATQVPAGAPVEAPAPQLSSEGEAMLVRLLKKALVITPDSTDSDTILELPEVNPSNAKSVLEQLITLIRKYDPDTNLNK
jgi:hypothetical protein